MQKTIELFVCFGIPLIVVFLYFKAFAKVEDNTIFHIGLTNTATYCLWFSEIMTARFWGVSGMHLLGLIYLLFIAPILTIGFSYWFFVNKSELKRHRYALISSMIYVPTLSILLVLILIGQI